MTVKGNVSVCPYADGSVNFYPACSRYGYFRKGHRNASHIAPEDGFSAWRSGGKGQNL
jgi:hypothetical protein